MGEKIIASPKPIDLCPTHTKETWLSHQGYFKNPDGSISCKFCGWGTYLPGYLKLVGDRIIDLRDINRD